MTVPGGGEGTILPRLCSQPGERRPGPGAAHARSPPPAQAPPPCGPGLARHRWRGAGPGAPRAVGAGKFGREQREGGTAAGRGGGPRSAPPGCGRRPEEQGGTGRVEVNARHPLPRRCLPIARGVQWGPLPGRTTGGGMGPWASLRGAGSPGTPAGHRPAGGRAQRGRWSPGNSPAAARAGPDALAMCWPWPGSLVPLPMASCVGTTRPSRGQGGRQVSRASLLWRES